jgi:hypothetical protein
VAGGFIIAAVFAFLGYRVLTRIILPELSDKLRKQAGDYWPNGHRTAVPDDFHGATTNGTEAQHHA